MSKFEAWIDSPVITWKDRALVFGFVVMVVAFLAARAWWKGAR